MKLSYLFVIIFCVVLCVYQYECVISSSLYVYILQVAFAVGVFSPVVAQIWQSIVLASDVLLHPEEAAARSDGAQEKQALPVYTLYNPMPTEAAVLNWLTLWHTLALHLPPTTLATLLFQLGFAPPAILPATTLHEVKPNAPETGMSQSSSSSFSSSCMAHSDQPYPMCFVCNCLEPHSGRAMDIASSESLTCSKTFNSNNAKPYSARGAIRKMGVFGRDQVGKTSIIAGFADLYSDNHKDQIREKVGIRDVVAGGFCLQVQSNVSPPETSGGNSSARKNRKSKSKNVSPAASSTGNNHTSHSQPMYDASCFVHYIASEVPGNMSVYADEEDDEEVDSLCHSGHSSGGGASDGGVSINNINNTTNNSDSNFRSSSISHGSGWDIADSKEESGREENILLNDEDFSSLPLAHRPDKVSSPPLPGQPPCPQIGQHEMNVTKTPTDQDPEASAISRTTNNSNNMSTSSLTSEDIFNRRVYGISSVDISNLIIIIIIIIIRSHHIEYVGFTIYCCRFTI